MLLKAILRRTAAGVATLLIVSILVFIGTSVLPGDVAEIILGQMATPENLAALRAKLGLDQPAYLRYFSLAGRPFDWRHGGLQGRCRFRCRGNDHLQHDRRPPVEHRAAERDGRHNRHTAVPGPRTADRDVSGTRLDRIVTFGTLSLISVPEFLVATFLVLVLAIHLGWLPSIAYMSGNETGWQWVRALAMPTLTLVIVVSAQIIRMTRATVLNVLNSPYIEMAILKGVPRRRIILRHALLNAIGPIVNVIALNLAWLVGGVVIVETCFSPTRVWRN